MPIFRAEVVLGAKSGLVKDACVNNFIFDDDGAIADNGGPLVFTQAIEHFYNDVPAGGLGAKVCQFLGPQLTRVANGVQVRYYDLTGALDGSATGSPRWMDAFTLGAEDTTTSQGCPGEVAACLTLRGDGWDTSPVNIPAGAPGPQGDLRPRQRHSGRIFLGPIDTGALSTDATTGRTTLGAYIRSAATHAAKALASEFAFSGGPGALKVWSRVAGVVLDVVAAQMDDAPDTQRRRGIAPTVRDLVTF